MFNIEFKSDLTDIADVSTISLDDCGILEFSNFYILINYHGITLKFQSDICDIYIHDIQNFISNITNNLDTSLKFNGGFLLSYSNKNLIFSIKNWNQSSLYITFNIEENTEKIMNIFYKLLIFSIKYDELYRLNYSIDDENEDTPEEDIYEDLNDSILVN
jgi:hypothetical protein